MEARMDPDGVRSPPFPATRHSVDRAHPRRQRSGRAPHRPSAISIEGYWKPVYKHLRITWRLDPDDARDLTQGFFAEAFQKAWLERYEPGKARFRTFVRVCADRFVMNTRQSASRLKRGGGAYRLPLDFDGVEREVLARHVAVQRRSRTSSSIRSSCARSSSAPCSELREECDGERIVRCISCCSSATT